MTDSDRPTAEELARGERLARALRDPAAYSDPGPVEHLETHISHVFLTGAHAYKIKKPVNLGFLDFTTLAQRLHFCEEEVRINRRLAPEIYLGVVPIAGSVEHPRVEGPGTPIDYAVKMRRFAQQDVLDHVADAGALTPSHVDEIARRLAAFHEVADAAPPGGELGSPGRVREAASANFAPVRALLGTAAAARLAAVQAWTEQEGMRLAARMAQRRAQGRVRECHGDLHLGNIALLAGRIVLFDALEFDEALRWIDVVNEVAFLAMDLHAHARPDLAARFVDAWCSHSGDYAGLALLRYYEVYRALVRAKVVALRAGQQPADAGERRALIGRCEILVGLADALRRPVAPALVLLHGVSGSGKTWASQRMLEATGAMRIRSDVERKRLGGMHAHISAQSPVDTGLYAEDVSARTYARLAALAGEIVCAGFPVLVDATFLRKDRRDALVRVARDQGVPAHIASFVAPDEVLRARVRTRHTVGNDASDATLDVLEQQLRTREPLSDAERAIAVEFDTSIMSDADIARCAREMLCTAQT